MIELMSTGLVARAVQLTKPLLLTDKGRAVIHQEPATAERLVPARELLGLAAEWEQARDRVREGAGPEAAVVAAILDRHAEQLRKLAGGGT